MSTSNYRLPRHVSPVDYDVDVDATPKRQTFGGSLKLTVKVHEKSDRFEMNARDLKVSNVRATAGKQKLKGKAKQDSDREVVELSFGAELPRGKVVIDLDFKGKLNPSMHGLYLAKDGPERAIVSQCEATDARAIFPCFDEPDRKATLKWTVRTDPGLTVVTNGVPDGTSKTRKKPVRVVHKFKRTKVISTYLAAITIGRLEATKAKRVARIPCRVLCGEGKLDQTDFAQDVTTFVLPWYEEYFGHRYNYQKLDQVAVPGFDAGAMENIGAIFYRQNLLLMQPGTASWSAQKRIAEVIAHEIAHQWFGNLVTMKWWDDLWLNEAFATWIAYKSVNEWKPDWRMWDDYLDSKESALGADSLVNTHPIYTPVESPAEATELFDLITYEKGCAVLRMAESYLGDGAFRKGIRAYIDAHKNDNAAGSDLWNSLAKASGQPVDTLMQSWITQSGFPLVTVTLGEAANQSVLHLHQQRFFANAGEMQKGHDQRWQIPMVIEYDAGNGVEFHRLVFEDEKMEVELPTDAHVKWVYPNSDATGFYRMRFDDDCLRNLLEHGLGDLAPATRMSLIEDQWALVRNGLSDVEQFMDVLAAFRSERDHVVVRSLASRLHYLDQRLVSDEDRPALARFTRWLFSQQLDELGWEASPEEGPERSERRAAVISALGHVGRDEDLLNDAEGRLAAEMDDPTSVEPNLAGTLVQLGAIRGDASRLDRYIATYLRRKKNGAAPQLQARYMGSLWAFEDPKVAAKVRALCLDETVPQEQLRTVLQPLLGHRTHGRETWKFLKKNWATLSPQVGSMGIARLVEATGALPVELRSDVAGFFRKNPVDEAKRALQKALEAMDLRKELLGREQARLSDWLRRAPAGPLAAAAGP